MEQKIRVVIFKCTSLLFTYCKLQAYLQRLKGKKRLCEAWKLRFWGSCSLHPTGFLFLHVAVPAVELQPANSSGYHCISVSSRSPSPHLGWTHLSFATLSVAPHEHLWVLVTGKVTVLQPSKMLLFKQYKTWGFLMSFEDGWCTFWPCSFHL